MQYMNEQDWAEFNQRFPSAIAWLNHRQLVNELAYLRNEFTNRPQLFTKWQSERLHELEQWELAVA